MGTLTNVAKWECPLCHKRGRRWLNVWKARKWGRKHLIKYHKEYKVEPILNVIKVEDVGDGKSRLE